MTHPNAFAAGGAGCIASALILILGAFGVPVPPQAIGVIVTAVSTVVLVIGREGLRNVVQRTGRRIWFGERGQ